VGGEENICGQLEKNAKVLNSGGENKAEFYNFVQLLFNNFY
jgi:hypothetical protein